MSETCQVTASGRGTASAFGPNAAQLQLTPNPKPKSAAQGTLPNSFGLTKTLGTDSIAEMDNISLLHLNLGLGSFNQLGILEPPGRNEKKMETTGIMGLYGDYKVYTYITLTYMWYTYEGLRTQKSGKAEPSANRSAFSPVNQHMSHQSAEAENIGYCDRSYIGVI